MRTTRRMTIIRTLRVLSALAFSAATLSLVPSSVEAATPACGMTITTPGVHTLTGDLNCGSGPGVGIGVDGVTLDLDGFRLSGTGAYGVRAVGVDDTSIIDGKISRFVTGIDASDGTGLIVDGVTVVQPQQDGVRIEGFLSALITDVRIMRPNFGVGIVAVDGEEISIAQSVVSRAASDGIRLRNVVDWAVRFTTVVNNGRLGLNVDETPGQGFAVDVNASRNELGGIRIRAAVPTTSLDPIVTIDNAKANVNARSGIIVDASSRVVVHDSSTIDNARDGITIRSGAGGHAVTNNMSRSNDRDGVRMENASSVELISNRSERNDGNGVTLDGSTVVSRSNTAIANGRHGQAWVGPGDGTSDFDRAQANAGDGFFANLDPSHSVVITQARADDNLASGVRSASAGQVEVDGGVFNDNGGSGVRIASGSGVVANLAARRNGASGVELRSGTTGSIDAGSMTHNTAWGLRIDPTSTAVSFFNHLFAFNGLGGCSGCI